MSFKKCRDMSSNIAIRSRAKNRGLVINDIAFAFKGGSTLPTVPVVYAKDSILNVPSMCIEDLPTDAHRADSDYQDELDSLSRSIENQINREVKQSQTSKQQKEEKIEKTE